MLVGAMRPSDLGMGERRAKWAPRIDFTDESMPFGRVGRHAGTIAREVARNGGRDDYGSIAAHERALRCRRRPRPARLAAHGVMRERVTTELRAGRSPLAIAWDLRAEGGDRVCVETIYQAVYTGVLDVRGRDCLRSRRPRRRHRQARQACSRPVLPSITARPVAVNERAEPGHWEIDAIIGARNRSAMLWLAERVSKYVIPVTMPCGYTAEETLAGLVEAFETIPAHLRRSVTFDRGSEWAEWETLAASYHLDVWFCDPHSPWQRGQIENHNRQARWWFPRGTDLAAVRPADAQAVADLLNHQRRRSLHNNSPATIYAALTAR
jgi:transposase, IS30 family